MAAMTHDRSLGRAGWIVPVAAALAVAGAMAAPAPRADGAAPAATSPRSCGISASFPGPATYFSVDQEDPFGRLGKLTGAEFVSSDRSLLLQYSCFKPVANRPFQPEREEAIQAYFEHTRKLGTFGQSYFYKRLQDAVLFVVSGERTVGGKRYVVKWENQFMPYLTMTVTVSYRAGDQASARRAQEFIDSVRGRSKDS